MKKSVYDIVTEKVIGQLEKGVVPWRMPWINGGAVNWKTQKPYRGMNTFLLEAGGQVKKGGKSHIVVFWKWLEKEDGERGKIEKIPYLRYYRVFEINQVEGLESKRKEITFDHNPIERAEEIYKGYINGPDYTFYSGKAVYYPTVDKINCPPLKDFPKVEEYYSTLFHEMLHSTGHKTRLARSGVITQNVAFGDDVYSKEELIAEMGAAMLCGVAGIDNNTIENSASYIDSWIRALKGDKSLVVQAAAQAQKRQILFWGKRKQKRNKRNVTYKVTGTRIRLLSLNGKETKNRTLRAFILEENLKLSACISKKVYDTPF